jgi:Flp pilus assembly protein TadG
MRRTTRRTSRRGAVTVEAAIVIPVFLLMVIGMIDLGLGMARRATLSHACREGARQAAVHGRFAPAGWNGGPWGTAAIASAPAGTIPTIIQQADVDGWPANAVRPMLVNCSPSETTVQVEWLDSSDLPEKRVRVTVTSSYRPMTTWLFGGAPITLRATSTVLISH